MDVVYFGLVLLLLAWGVAQLLADDPDGGRHPMGLVMLAVGVAAALAGVLVRRARRR